MRRKIFSILFGLMFIAGFLILAYPTIANQWNTYRQQRLISHYSTVLEEMEPEEREKEYLPQKYDSLRRTPAYDQFVKERFERCLDLYLAPRIRKNRLNIDPNSLLPKLPRPEELRPFPTVASIEYAGHEGRVRSVAIDPSGHWLASGGDDGTVRVWGLADGKQQWKDYI